LVAGVLRLTLSFSIGPVDLTQGTLSPDTNALIPTVTDNLFAQRTIPANSIGIFFEPTTSGQLYRPNLNDIAIALADFLLLATITNGEMTFGGT
jgi:cathepsin E